MRTNTFAFRRPGASILALGVVLTAFMIGVTMSGVSRERATKSDSSAVPLDRQPLQARSRAMPPDTTGRLSIEDPRPLAKAIQMLENKYGLVITYEDPRYTHASEITDVTEKVRRDLDKFEPGKAPKVLIPKGGKLSFAYDEALAAGTEYRALLVQQLIDAYSASDNAGRFRVEQQGRVINVIPTAVKNRRGEVAPQSSLLDAIITVPKEQRSGIKMLQAICAAIKLATGTRVLLLGAPSVIFLRYQNDEGIAGKQARDALAELLTKVEDGAPLSWQLLYDPGLKMYGLSIHEVRLLNRPEPQ